MHGVGPSTVLGGRYAVQRRLEQMPHAERWSAHDTTLERDVVIVCFSEKIRPKPADTSQSSIPARTFSAATTLGARAGPINEDVQNSTANVLIMNTSQL